MQKDHNWRKTTNCTGSSGSCNFGGLKKKKTRAYLFQIALEIMWLPIRIKQYLLTPLWEISQTSLSFSINPQPIEERLLFWRKASKILSRKQFLVQLFCVFTYFSWIAHWNFLLVSWFSRLVLSVLGVCPLIGSFRKILLLQFWLLDLDSVYRKALYGINLLTTVVMRGENVRFLAWSHLASEKAP